MRIATAMQRRFVNLLHEFVLGLWICRDFGATTAPTTTFVNANQRTDEGQSCWSPPPALQRVSRSLQKKKYSEHPHWQATEDSAGTQPQFPSNRTK